METTPVNATRMFRIPVSISADREGIVVTLHSADGFAETPTATLRLRGSAETLRVPLDGVASRGSFVGHVRGLPASSEGTIEVRGATPAGLAGSAVEDFSFVKTKQALRFVGPGGHMRLDLDPARDERVMCIGPPGLDVLAFPRNAVLIGRAYAITTTEERFSQSLQLTFRLPRGSIDRNAERVALGRWNGSWATWDRIDATVRTSDWQMLTARLTVPGVYAVIEYGRSSRE